MCHGVDSLIEARKTVLLFKVDLSLGEGLCLYSKGLMDFSRAQHKNLKRNSKDNFPPQQFDLIHGTMVISWRPVWATQQDLNLKKAVSNYNINLFLFKTKQNKEELGL